MLSSGGGRRREWWDYSGSRAGNMSRGLGSSCQDHLLVVGCLWRVMDSEVTIPQSRSIDFELICCVNVVDFHVERKLSKKGDSCSNSCLIQVCGYFSKPQRLCPAKGGHPDCELSEWPCKAFTCKFSTATATKRSPKQLKSQCHASVVGK